MTTTDELPKATESVESPCIAARIEHFKFDLNQRVLVREIQRPGKVVSLIIDNLGPQYQVAFWDNGERKTAWLLSDELEDRK